MTNNDAEQLAQLAKHTPEALPDVADKVRHLARNWQHLADSVRAADITRTNGRLVITMPADLSYADLYELDVL